MNVGGCYCGAVRYEAASTIGRVTFCHCSKCRKWHGHFGAYTAVPRADFKIIEQRGLKWHAVSATVRRGFCQECGSSLFFDEEGDKHISICPGTLDGPTGLKPKAHIFVGSKGDYYELGDGLEQRDEYT
jgi:hypothetical protein